MKANSFIEGVLEMLGIEDDRKKSKKKSIKNLLEKLENKREKTIKKIKSNPSKDLKLELDIIEIKIKKGKKILEKLKNESNDQR